MGIGKGVTNHASMTTLFSHAYGIHSIIYLLFYYYSWFQLSIKFHKNKSFQYNFILIRKATYNPYFMVSIVLRSIAICIMAFIHYKLLWAVVLGNKNYGM